MPALGVVALCVLSLLAGCVGGLAVGSPGGGKTTAAADSPSPANSAVTRTPSGGGVRKGARTARPRRTTAKPRVQRTKASPRRTTAAPSLDHRYPTCAAANRAGLGPYVRGVDPEYRWYQDRDGDGVVCERA